ncbi:MAG: endonuclease [Bacteroidales bacterium]|jgi:endonuclease I|nr:endonuclease [Bacteroidales bacterium]
MKILKKIFIVSLLLVVSQNFYAQAPEGYYDSATGTGYLLKTQLHDIIKDHTSLSYTPGVWDAFYTTDVRPDGYVWDMYSDVPGGSADYYYTLGSDQCGNYSGEGSCYNREHSFPKSWFDDGYPMYTDLFHLYPTDGFVNGQRGNYPFGEVGSIEWESSNGSKVGTCNYPGYSGTVFEPIDEYKGDFARTYFYMATRYEDIIAGWEFNESNGNVVLNGTSNQVYEEWYLDMIIEWHTNDPVSPKELDRNDAVYALQGNRNPFIDHPEFVAQIWGGGNVPPSIAEISLSPQNPTSTESVSVSATITDADGTITGAWLNWGLSSGSLSNTINMSNASGDTYVIDSPIPAQADGTSVYFQLEAEDDSAATNTSVIQSYTVGDPGTLPFQEDFETVTEYQPVDINGWTQYIEAGTETWEGRGYNGNLYAQFSAYSTGEASTIGWLITPVLDLTGYSGVIFSFKSKDGYYNGDPLEVLISTDYPGTGNPNGYSWEELNPVLSTGSTGGYADNWTASGELSLNSYTGNTVYIAFKYTGGDPSLTTTMQIDDVLVEEGTVANQNPVISSIQYTPESPSSSEEVNVSASITDADGTISQARVNWGLSEGNLTHTIGMNPASGDVYTTETAIPPQDDGSTVYFNVEAEDNQGGFTTTMVQSYQVTDPENQAPVISEVLVDPDNPTENDEVSISASVVDQDGTVASVLLKWKKDEDVYQEQNMSYADGKYSGQIPRQPSGTTIHFIIRATDDLSAESTHEDSFVVSQASAVDQLSVEQVKVYPNPVTDQMNIAIPGYSGSLTVKWYDAIGSLIRMEPRKLFNQKGTFSLDGIVPGVYFVGITMDSGATITRRVVVY